MLKAKYLSNNKLITKIDKIISDKSSFTNLISSQNFLYFFCSLAFLTSIFIRSRINIGPDTAIYIGIAKKMVDGGRYYYDFYESNFPLSFYFYVWQYYFSYFSGINPIITSEIFINVFALAAILWSAKILKKTTIYDNKAYYNLIIIGYFIGFFYRNPAMLIGEYGTKTSLFFIFAYPYIAYCFERKSAFSKKDLLLRGLLMAAIPCVKPSYIFLVIPVEIYNFFQSKKLKFFFELDKITALVVGIGYLIIMWFFTREFFTYMVPMWSMTYPPYKDLYTFFSQSFRHIPDRLILPCFLFLSFLYKKISKNDKILILIFLGAYINSVLEAGISNDQISTYHGILIIMLLKFSYDLLALKEFSFYHNKFIFLLLFLVPLFDISNFFASLFGIMNIWWVILLVSFSYILIKIKLQNQFTWLELVKNIKLSNIILTAILLILLSLISLYLIALVPYGSDLSWDGENRSLVTILSGYIVINFAAFLIGLCIFEKLHKKFFKKFSVLSIVVTISVMSSFLSGYLLMVSTSSSGNSIMANIDKLTTEIVKYSKIYAPKKEDKIILFSRLSVYLYPLANYLDKDADYKVYSQYLITNNYIIGDYYKNEKNQNITSPKDPVFVHRYFYDDVMNLLQNTDSKIILIDNSLEIKIKRSCILNQLEIMFRNPEFKRAFFRNFKYQGRMVVYEKSKYKRPSVYLFSHKKDVFDNVKSSKMIMLYDFEVYVRR
jgi:hypothetical protein